MTFYRVVVPPEGHPSRLWAENQANPSVAYPAVVPHTASPFSGDNNMRVPRWAWDATRNRNSARGWKALRRNNAGWINWAANKQWSQGEVVADFLSTLPVVEGVVTVGNLVNVVEIFKGRARITTSTPDDIIWIKFNSINAKEELGNAPDGVESYIPLIAKDEAWLDMDVLEKVEEEPMEDNFAKGIDISKWDVKYDAFKKPMDFVFIKASEGSSGVDKRFEQHVEECASVPVVGAYHYYRSGIPWRDQMDNFLKVTEKHDI